MKNSLLAAGVLVFAATAFGQSAPASNRPATPVPPENTVADPAPATPSAAAPASTPAATAPDAPVIPAAPAVPAPANASAPVAGEAPAPRVVRELVFAEADIDKDGRVSLHEYTTFVESRVETRGTEIVREETIQCFLDLDQNNDAHLSASEASTPPAPVPQAVPPPRVRR